MSQIEPNEVDQTPQEFVYDLSRLGIPNSSIISVEEGKFLVTPFEHYPLGEVVVNEQTLEVFHLTRKLFTIDDDAMFALKLLLESLTDKRDTSSVQDSPTIEFDNSDSLPPENDRRITPHIRFDG